MNLRKKSTLRVFQDRNTPRTGTKPLPDPTHLGHFVLMVVLKLCRSVLFVDTSVKIGVYLIGVMLGSIICDLFVVPKSYFSDKRNIFNEYFVKLGWGWTLSFIATYLVLSSWVFCIGKWTAIRRHLMRLGVATVQWYVCVTAFKHVEHTVGMCTDSEYTDRIACISDGKGWLGFDISGHVFLLMHNLLTISEEVKTFKNWRKLGELLADTDLEKKRKIDAEEIVEAQALYKNLTPYIKVAFIGVAALTVLWEFMLFISVVYRFHTLPQKVAASFVAVFCWFLSYRILYPSKINWLPVQPGECALNYMKN